MNAVLLIAHAPLASALRAGALHVFPDAGASVVAIDVRPEAAPEASLAAAQAALASLPPEQSVLILTDVYPAGEEPIAGADARALARAVRAHGRVVPALVEHPRDLKSILPGLLADGDLLLLAGAGDIGGTAVELARMGKLEVVP